MPTKKLKQYKQMRRPGSTLEPYGQFPRAASQLFVVQQHAARRLHWDLRLEFQGTLKSWAVPKGPSPNPKDKRLAVKVEDHPIEYASFEGNIPEGNYGAGTVILWDRGTWLPLEDPEEGFEKGKLLFELRGYKLKGVWALVRIKKSPKDWLLIKERDAYVEDEVSYSDHSIVSGLTQKTFNDREKQEKKLQKFVKSLKAPKAQLSKKDLRPMLATAEKNAFTRNGWVFELKYDGYRMLAAKEGETVTLLTRNGNEVTQKFPELQECLQALPYENFVLDGEVVVLDENARPSFRSLQKRFKLSGHSEIQVAAIRNSATLFCFDILSFGDFDLRSLPLLKRKSVLRKLLIDLGPLRYSDHFDDGKKLFELTTELRLEGIVAKKANSKYAPVRTENWLKIRCDRTDDFVVVGYTAAKRSRPGFGALLLGVYEGKKLTFCGRVGTGFSDKVLKELRQLLEPLAQNKASCVGELPTEKGIQWIKPKIVAEVRYKQWNDLLRQASFLKIRDDKNPKDCQRQVESPSQTEGPPTRKQKTKKKVVSVTNTSKVFWPKEKYTKGDLIAYYQTVSPWLLKYLKDRPLVLTRYPDGIEGKSFYQKDAPVFTPDWIRTEPIWSDHSKRDVKFFICDSKETLTYIINLGVIPIHLWASHTPQLQKPDWCVLDLDPKEAPFKHVVEIAKAIHSLCKEIKLPCFVKTSGSTGLHILLPLQRKFTHHQSKTMAELIATTIVAKLPKIATVTRNPAKREGKVYIDYLQNGWGKTIAAPFCVRPLPGAPVSIPLKWTEVTHKLKLSDYTIETVPKRLKKQKSDPLLPLLRAKPNLPQVLKLLSKKL